jgi:hypothetical protein
MRAIETDVKAPLVTPHSLYYYLGVTNHNPSVPTNSMSGHLPPPKKMVDLRLGEGQQKATYLALSDIVTMAA